MIAADEEEVALHNDDILIVDDQETNRILLTEILNLEGYQTVVATNGHEALARIAEAQPALVLLDVNMPGMNGFTVCREIRQRPASASLPVILVTALGHREHRLEGITAGANDYITKPIDRPDLLLRVRNAMHLRAMHRELAQHLASLRRLERLRDSLVHMLVHDLRSPLTTMMAYLDMTRTSLIARNDHELVRDIDEVADGTQRLARMVNDLLDVSRLEESELPLRRTRADLHRIADEVVGRLGPNAGGVAVTLEPAVAGHEAPISVDVGLVQRVIRNLIDNAIKFSPSGSRVHIAMRSHPQGHGLEVTDSGPGIPAEYHQRIFEKFGTVDEGTRPRMPSTGLGLTFCKMVVDAHQGSIGLRSSLGQGSTFWVSFPAAS